MKLYDISQEVFGCQVYPGDRAPRMIEETRMDRGDLYNLTSFEMCAHNGTHIDAPFHFLKDGKTVEEITLEKMVGLCCVAEHSGVMTAEDAKRILERVRGAADGNAVGRSLSDSDSAAPGLQNAADRGEMVRERNAEAARRILIKGMSIVSAEAAEVFAKAGIDLLGVESQSVGPEDAPMEVHRILLSAETVLLEGIRLGAVEPEIYWLSAAPLCLAGADGAPCRAVLVNWE